MDQQITGGTLVVKLLASFGVTHVFGIPGGQTLAITDAILAHPQMEFVTARHEGAAAVMADAYGRLTGTPGVCLATTGPGATNLLTGVGGALRDSSPMIVITCNNNGENIHKDDAQNADHVELFRPLTKWSRLVAHGTGIKQALEEAYVRAMTGNPGPVHLDFARDTIEGLLTPPKVAEIHPSRAWVGQRPQPAISTIAEAAQLVGKAKRPVLWLGNGCNRGNAGAQALALAEALQIPIVTTFNGTGCVPTTHPLVFGPLSRMGTNLTSRVIGDADLVIAVGNSLNAVSTGRWQLRLPQIVQIDVEPGTIGRYYGDRTLGIVGDAAATLDAINDALADDPEAKAATAARADWIDMLTEQHAAWWAESSVPSNRSADGPMSPADIVRRLREVAPDNTLLIPDAGNPGIWSYLWEIREPGTYIKPVGFGNMGFAVPAAVAAAVIDPQRPVLVLVGDGSLGMSLAELETLARVGGRVVVVVLNDDSYGNIRQEQEVHFNGRTIGVDFGPSNYALVAEGLGLSAKRITRLDELADAVARAFAGDVPVLFDAPIDRNVNAWTYPAFAKFDAQDG